ncbi:hypothetical protein LCGC14_2387670 [marine sediment metagenome]|uniref:Uncharacterized protein n=1 Tax=marine sediment metagenome TaxID=412755 RepID=A0A0F9CL96_9ZZZZ
MGTKGTGTTVTFGTSAFAAELLDVSGPNVTRESLDITHMGTTEAREFVEATLYDGGEVTFTLQYDVDDTPPQSGATETVTIAFAGTGNVNFSGFLTSFSVTAAIDEIMQATMGFKVTGAVAWS